jgi:hypothetical protein
VDEPGPEHALSDALLEREIAEALRVEPSREFVARVRCAIAAGPAPGRWQFPWTWAAAVGLAAVVVVVTAGVVRRAGPDRPLAPDPPQLAAAAVVPTPPDVTVPGPVDRPVRRAPRPATVDRAGPAAEPDVLIAREEAAALKRLLQGIPEPVVEAAATEAAPDGFEALHPPPAIVVSPMAAIRPIAIEPLGLEGGEQQ